MRIPIHREGRPFIGIFAAVNALAFLVSSWLGWALVPLTLWCVAFFRDPERRTPDGVGLIISPADGKLLPIVRAAPPEELGLGPAPLVRLSIFMDVFNVHVNRIPHEGTIAALNYRKGRFFNASFDKASEHNERMSFVLRIKTGTGTVDLAVAQIAGLVARRIKCDLSLGQEVRRGVRFGIIRFGSRLDVYLPEGAVLEAKPGQKVVGGETVLARL